MEEKEVGGPVRKLERVAEKKFRTYEEADLNRKSGFAGLVGPAKVKIFRRNDGTFDLVAYRKVQTEAEVKEEKEVKKKRYTQPKN